MQLTRVSAVSVLMVILSGLSMECSGKNKQNLDFSLDFDICPVIYLCRLKAVLFAGAEGGAGGPEFQCLKNG